MFDRRLVSVGEIFIKNQLQIILYTSVPSSYGRVSNFNSCLIVPTNTL